MPQPEPTLHDVEEAIAELLRTEEIGALAVLDSKGAPSVSMMHFAADGLTVYTATFGYTRKYAAMARDPRVSYTIAYLPPGGFSERLQARSIQVDGIATKVTDPEEIHRAVEVSREQFLWAQGTSMFDNFLKGTAHHQDFFRIDPVEALWNDNRVRQLWRRLVTFTPDGRHVAELRPYATARNPL
ncbi:pyridoxamine 5'-phosphate oxidase family protein [Mycobacterium deserti]|uniref:Pyridoxamine 5'-phosphate oxidase family protein n=1 Tax=Mycobacterium deserti TaxID=2978347 RepID=A0ABT2M8R6_9MYCO|nr:pyridoxamine 5'-phosphate oxidase family protein [Mycobacterium deserti]MCT7657999.1 pyridoxamine 5'-phosphate oxidase family protein [Mycobacterium deserti]